MKNESLILIIVGVVALFLIVGVMTNVAYGSQYSGYGGMMGMMYGGGFSWIFGWLFMGLIFVALILFIMWMMQQLEQNGGKRKKW